MNGEGVATQRLPDGKESKPDDSVELQARNILLTALVGALVALGANSAYYLYRGWNEHDDLVSRSEYLYQREDFTIKNQSALFKIRLGFQGWSETPSDDVLLKIISKHLTNFISNGPTRGFILDETRKRIQNNEETLSGLLAYSPETTGVPAAYFDACRGFLQSQIDLNKSLHQAAENHTKESVALEHVLDGLAIVTAKLKGVQAASEDISARRKLREMEFKTEISALNNDINRIFFRTLMALVGLLISIYGLSPLIAVVSKYQKSQRRIVTPS